MSEAKKHDELAKKQTEETGPLAQFVESINEDKEKFFFSRPNCKLCQSEHRAASEELYQTGKNFKQVYDFLIEQKENDISYNAVVRHLRAHYSKQQRALKLNEYMGSVSKWQNRARNRKRSLEERLSFLNNELVNILAENDETVDMDEKRKNLGQITSLNDSIGELEDKLQAMDEQFEPVFLVITKVQDVISSHVKATRSDDVKKELLDLLSDLEKNFKDLKFDNQE